MLISCQVVSRKTGQATRNLFTNEKPTVVTESKLQLEPNYRNSFTIAIPLLEWILQNMVRHFVTYKQVQADE